MGKANNLLSRVQTHAVSAETFKVIERIAVVEWVETANEIEALIKESDYIKHYDPKLNVRLRDGKQYWYVGITHEEYPRVFTTHQPLQPNTHNLKPDYIGPFTDGGALKTTMRYIRKLFPYYTANPRTLRRVKSAMVHRKLPCAYCHLDMCPGPEPDKRQYRKNVIALKRVLSGKKNTVIKALKKEMREHSRTRRFEEAAQKRDIIAALQNIFSHHNVVAPWSPQQLSENDHDRTSAGTYLTQLLKLELPVRSIEGYDISNIQGKEPTASMVRFNDARPNKSLYRKFNIQAPPRPNDYLMMREVLTRRLQHNEWPYPDLLLIDGGKGHLNAARTALLQAKLSIPVVSLAKRLEELYIPGRARPLLLSSMPDEVNNLLRHIRDESHRFAISHHRARHRKVFKR